LATWQCRFLMVWIIRPSHQPKAWILNLIPYNLDSPAGIVVAILSGFSL
jgi:hypothetical protein